MRWIITDDNVNDGNSVYLGEFDDGSRHYQNEGKVPATLATMATEFRLLDDEGTVQFEGRLRVRNVRAVSFLAPLEWAADDGCTVMEYRPVGSLTRWVRA